MSLDIRHKLVPIARQTCRELRKRATRSERIFWDQVRNRRFLNLKFYRQYPLFVDAFGRETFFVADFYCHEKRLVIEIDGKIHDLQKDHDILRENLIRENRIKVIRFRDDEIESNIEEVMRELKEFIGSQV